MTHVCVTEVEHSHLKDEYKLIEDLCRWEGITHNSINKHNSMHQKYYNGGRPMVLVFHENKSEPDLCYGFWEFVVYVAELKKTHKGTI